MVPKHLPDTEVGSELMHRQAVFGVTTKYLWRLVHEWRRRHGHLKAAVHVIHHAAKRSQAATGAVEVMAGEKTDTAEEPSSRIVVGRLPGRRAEGRFRLSQNEDDGAAAG